MNYSGLLNGYLNTDYDRLMIRKLKMTPEEILHSVKDDVAKILKDISQRLLLAEASINRIERNFIYLERNIKTMEEANKVENKSVEEPKVAEEVKPAEEAAPEAAPAEEKPAEEKPAEEAPKEEEKPAEEKPAEDAS